MLHAPEIPVVCRDVDRFTVLLSVTVLDAVTSRAAAIEWGGGGSTEAGVPLSPSKSNLISCKSLI